MSSCHNQAITYRPEIDGLRAIAVLPVIFFHAGFELFPGGFVGVDIFFVISGFLITSILLREMEAGQFSIIRFYARRARRILPVLFFVMACCLPFAWMWMLPDEMKRFGQSAIAVATFSSNIYFLRETNYFSPSAESQPLLHTWSLAVEEQYYVLFPLFLILCWRFGKSKLFWFTLVAALCSLALSEWGWRHQAVANFYLLPTRAWEILAGSLLAFLPPLKAAELRQHPLAQSTSLLGMGLILFSILNFDSSTPFPGFYTLVPVVGTVLIIAFASAANWTGKLLSSQCLVSMGLISYSAYLWHQPVFAFIRLRSLEHPTQLVFSIGAAASLALAYLSWRFIEQPARTAVIEPNRLLALSAGGLLAVSGLGVLAHASEGFAHRATHLSSWQAAKTQPKEQMEIAYRRGTCFIDYHQDIEVLQQNDCVKAPLQKQQIILGGDSMAAHYYLALKDFAAHMDLQLSQINGTSCRPYQHANMSTRCQKLLKMLQQTLALAPEGSFVVISAKWQKEFKTDENFQHNIRQLIERAARSSARVIFIGQIPTYAVSPNEAKLRLEMMDENVEPGLKPDDTYRPVNTLLRTSIDAQNMRGNLVFIDPVAGLCSGSGCNTFSAKGVPLYIDQGHLTPTGAKAALTELSELAW